MKKTLKLVAILISVLVVVIVGGLSIYLLMQNNQTYYVYDLRIVEPVSGERTYVYTDGEKSYSSFKNRSVYLRSNSENRLEIGVYARTSNGMTNVYPESSNEDVAKIIYSNGLCYVNYLKAGETTISVSIGTVTDSFVLTVYDIVADKFIAFDDNYYGNFSSQFPNELIAYSDGATYSYNYEAKSSIASGYSVNNDMLRVSNIDTSIIENVTIDPTNHKLLIKCKSGIPSNVDTTITVQSYTIAEDGKIKVLENQNIGVHVVAYTPEFLQIELSTTPDFNDRCVFVDTKEVDAPSTDDEELKNSLSDYLDYKKAEYNLSNESAKKQAVYHTYFSGKVNKLYLRLRKVYTNGAVVYLTPNDKNKPYENTDKTPYALSTSDNSKLRLSANGSYYILTFTGSGSYNITLKLNGENYLESSFVFEYLNFTESDITKVYDYNDGVFTFKYWDERTRFVNEIYDESGNVIGFAGIDTSYFNKQESKGSQE